MSWYKAGSVTSVAGTNVITGTGTLWSNPIFGIAPGQMIFVPGAGQVVIYEILAIDSDTQIRTSSNSASSITDSDYAIVTTVSNSMSDLARRTAVQLALYQGLLQDWQQITTGTGNVIIISPDGTEVTIPSLSQISQDISDKVSQQQLSGFGIGLPTQTTISNFDFQNFVFTSGANYLASSTSWLNVPAGVSYPTGLTISITVDYIANAGNNIGLTLIPNTVTNANFIVYKVLASGVHGSRTFAIRTEWNSANPVSITGGGHGANTLAGAQSALGIVADAFGASGMANTAWLSLTTAGGWSTAAGYSLIYRKVLGMLQFRVNLFATSVATPSIVGTLPVGYRPTQTQIVTPFGQRDTYAGLYPMRFVVNTDGSISVTQFQGTGEVSGTFLIPLQ